MLPEEVREKLEGLPTSPGVYLFRDRKGVVVYVGKAKSLRSRVRSYFQESAADSRYFIPILPRVVGDLETVVTATEKEAAILESSLIKAHRPRFNVKLRDDKEYISLRLDVSAPWPRLEVVRLRSADGAESDGKPARGRDRPRHFGPFHSATAARRTLHLVNKHFQLRTCTDADMRSRRRPCLQYQIKRCPAPCVLDVDAAFYAEQVRAVALFLEGRHDELSAELQGSMRRASQALQFELAAVYRDQLDAIAAVQEEQRVVSADGVDRDVLGLYRAADLVELAVLVVRGGRLAEVLTFSVKGAEVPDEEVVAAFLAHRYGAHDLGDGAAALAIPSEVLVPVLPDAAAGVGEWLAERAGHRVEVRAPQRGPRADLLALAQDNAAHAFREKRRESDDVLVRLEKMREVLRLPAVPRRIECCDISHLGGKDTVGAVVALLDGEPHKAMYRTFRLRGGASAGEASDVDLAGDDYRAIYEVLARRFRRGLAARRDADGSTDDDASAWSLPDLFVVDGGRGQLAVALAAARDLGLHDLPIVGLAKEKENARGETLVDRVYLPGQKNPIALRSHSAALLYLARARDEAHRFSNRGRMKAGKQRRLRSQLDEVRGVGPKIRTALLRELGSLRAVASADDATLLAVPGVTKRTVAALRAALGPAPDTAPPAPAAPPSQPPT